MADKTTTHVLEIESGIGEPAVIRLTLGVETQPISVGKKGMWRIASARVLDIHAFLYFDGESLFMQSTDSSNPAGAQVDGDHFDIGLSWVRLHAPCKIHIGDARFRFRSLDLDSDTFATTANVVVPGPPVRPRPLVSAPPSEPTLARDVEDRLSFPKPERPFRPGALSSSDEDENTRFKPLAGGGGGGPIVSTHSSPGGHTLQESTYVPVGHGPMRSALSMPPMPAIQGSSPPSVQAPSVAPTGYPQPFFVSGAHPYMQVLTGSGPYPQLPSGPYPHDPMGSGGYPNMGTMSSQPMNMPPGQPTLTGPEIPENGNADGQFIAQYKQWSPVKKAAMILLPVALVLGFMSLLENDPPDVRDAGGAGKKPEVIQKVDAASASTSARELPPWPPGVPCPPPNWPEGIPLPCKPNAVTEMPAPLPIEASPRGDASTIAAGKSTLQRQAVDAVSQGDLRRAASLYEELSRQQPAVSVYAESASILRAKLDGGT